MDKDEREPTTREVMRTLKSHEDRCEEHRKIVDGKLDNLEKKADTQTGWLIGIFGTVTTLMVASIVANVIIAGFFHGNTSAQANYQPPVIIFGDHDAGKPQVISPQQESEDK